MKSLINISKSCKQGNNLISLSHVDGLKKIIFMHMIVSKGMHGEKNLTDGVYETLKEDQVKVQACFNNRFGKMNSRTCSCEDINHDLTMISHEVRNTREEIALICPQR